MNNYERITISVKVLADYIYFFQASAYIMQIMLSKEEIEEWLKTESEGKDV